MQDNEADLGPTSGAPSSNVHKREESHEEGSFIMDLQDVNSSAEKQAEGSTLMKKTLLGAAKKINETERVLTFKE